MVQNAKTAAEATAPAKSKVEVEATIQAPIVYTVKKNKKKKKYSRGLKDPQKVERGTSRALERLAQAVADGVGEYRDRSDKSARKKRDGALRDAVRNAGRGLSEAISVGAKAPRDLTKRISARRLVCLVVPPPFSSFLRGR